MTTQPRVEWEQVSERWRMLMTDCRRNFNDPRIAIVNSDRWERIQDTLEELAARMVDEVHDDETDSLQALTEDIWQDIARRIIEWAPTIEAARAERRKAVAA